MVQCYRVLGHRACFKENSSLQESGSAGHPNPQANSSHLCGSHTSSLCSGARGYFSLLPQFTGKESDGPWVTMRSSSSVCEVNGLTLCTKETPLKQLNAGSWGSIVLVTALGPKERLPRWAEEWSGWLGSTWRSTLSHKGWEGQALQKGLWPDHSVRVHNTERRYLSSFCR